MQTAEVIMLYLILKVTKSSLNKVKLRTQQALGVFQDRRRGTTNYFLRKTERKFCAVLMAVSYELVMSTS